MPFFDPDRRLFTIDKLQHALGGAIVATAFLALGWGPVWSAVLTLAIGVTWELAQWDAARGIWWNLMGQNRFPPGWGFGVLDLAADMVGAAVPIAVYCYLGFTPLPSHPPIFDPHGFLPDERIALSTTSSGADTSTYSAVSYRSQSPHTPAVPLRSTP